MSRKLVIQDKQSYIHYKDWNISFRMRSRSSRCDFFAQRLYWSRSWFSNEIGRRAHASRRWHILFKKNSYYMVFSHLFFLMQVWNYMQKTCAVFFHVWCARTGLSKRYNVTKNGRSNMQRKAIFCISHSANVYAQCIHSYHETYMCIYWY